MIENSENNNAGVYIDDTPLVKEGGTLAVSGGRLVFIGENSQVSMHIANIELSLGGTANRVIYIKDPAQPRITLHTTNTELFRDPLFEGHEAVKKLFNAKNNHHSYLAVTFCFLVMLVLVPFWFIFIERDMMVNAIADQISPDVEIVIGETFYDLQFAEGTDILKGEELNRQLAKLIAPLLQKAQHPNFTYQVHIIKDESINAFAMPGGHIFIHSGLIERSERPEELLGVLAHEISHVTGRHSLKQTIHQLSGWTLMFLLSGGVDHTILTMGDQAKMLFEQGYSREQELESDNQGADYMIKAGVDLTGMLDFFEHIQEEETILNSDMIEWISTHPGTDGRIENMKARIAGSSQNIKKILFNYDRFKELLKEELQDLEKETTL